jgi:hypothetical protein
LAEVRSDASGEFVAIFQAPLSAEPQALTLEAETAAGPRVPSADVALLLPPAPAGHAHGAPPERSRGLASGPLREAPTAQRRVGGAGQAAPRQAAAEEAAPDARRGGDRGGFGGTRHRRRGDPS